MKAVFKKCPSCKYEKCWIKAPICEKCEYNFKLGKKPRKTVVETTEEDEVPVVVVEKPAPKKHKECPDCKHQCWHAAPVCEICEYDFKNSQSKRHRPRESPQINDRAGVIYVPALGRMAGGPLDFPELHWAKGQEPTNDNLLRWAFNLREAWKYKNESAAQEYLSNHAIGYLANTSKDKILQDNSERIVQLLGGDDWR